MAGLFSSGEQDLLGNIMTQREQANQALGSGYGKYGGIVQAAGGLIDTGTDAMFGGKVGAADPRMQQMSKVKDIFAKVTKELGDVKSPAFYERLSQELQAAGFPEQAQKSADEAVRQKKQGYEMQGFENADKARKAVADLLAKNPNATSQELYAAAAPFSSDPEDIIKAVASREEKAAKAKVKADEVAAQAKKTANRIATLTQKFPDMDAVQRQAIAEDDQSWRAAINPPPKDKTEMERLLASLNLSPEEEAAYRQRMLDLKLNPDPAGQKALANELARARIEEIQRKTQEGLQKTAEAKTAKINLLAATETNAEDALNTSAEALKLAPSDWMDATGQLILGNVPWTDELALNNLVTALNSEKVLSTLAEMKAQSRTGASGLGAVSEKELTLLMARTRKLDPKDKNFRENLKYVMNKWEKIRREARKARLAELGQTDDADPLGVR
jgi:hypothetical protein